jgi:hypothetical protein
MKGSRRAEVAALAGVNPKQVQEVTVAEVRSALSDRVSAVVLEVATSEPASYWRVDTTNRYFLDDSEFGEVVDFTNLDYNSDLGLYNSNWHKGKDQ